LARILKVRWFWATVIGKYSNAAKSSIIIFIIIIIVVSFMQGIHTHIPEKNHVPRGTLLQLFFVVYGASISSSCVSSFVLLR
jgi:hypothetical protein